MCKLDHKGSSGIRENVITFSQNPDKILQILPQIPSSSEIQILFTGKNKPLKNDLKKILCVRRNKIENCLIWLKSNNLVYKDITIDYDNLNRLPENDVPDEVFNEISYKADNMDSDELFCNEIGTDLIDRNNIEINDTNDLQSSGLISVLDATILSEKDKIEMIKYKHLNNKVLTIPCGKTPMNEWFNPAHLLYAFPSLFPYGIGGVMDESRRIKLSYRQHIVYLLTLNCNRFRVHRSFIFVTFNTMQRLEARANLIIHIKRKDHQKFADSLKLLTKEDYNQAIYLYLSNVYLTIILLINY